MPYFIRKPTKKPITIFAEQWFPGANIEGAYQPEHCNYATIHTLDGVMTALPGDWIITGIMGEKYPCKPGVFEATYEPVEEVTESL